MTELEKMKTYHATEEIKNTPPWMQDALLVMICKSDESGYTERMARILAAHKMPTNEIVPCIMDIMQDYLVKEEASTDDN